MASLFFVNRDNTRFIPIG